MNKQENNLIIYQKYMELIYYTNDIVRKFPKSETFALVKELKQSLYSGMRFLMYAIKSFKTQDKLKYLRELNVNLSLFKVYVRLSNKYKYITPQNKVYEPKERIIKALPYKDRVVHQWYIEEFIKPYFVPKLINTTYACLNDRGTHKAVDEVQKMICKFKHNYGDFWILKCDIRKFFYNIDPYILFNI